MDRLPKLIAIDGPAASGKSTIAERLAHRLGYLFFDTGVMYRAVTWAALLTFHTVADENQVTELANRIRIDVQPPSRADGRKYDVYVDGEDVTWQIRSPEVEANVSHVSAYVGVRQAMTDQQRRIGRRGATVMVGRDIGTVVFPEAPLKIYLNASVEERARRRYKEVLQRGQAASYDEILASMKRRDEIDSNRVIAPLKPAKDAIVVSTDGKTIDEVLDYVLDLVTSS